MKFRCNTGSSIFHLQLLGAILAHNLVEAGIVDRRKDIRKPRIRPWQVSVSANLGIERIREIARENGKKGGRPPKDKKEGVR